MKEKPTDHEFSPDKILAGIMPPLGLDCIVDLMMDGPDDGGTSLAVAIRPYYDERAGGLRNELYGHGIGYDQSLADIAGVTMITAEAHAQMAAETGMEPSGHRFDDSRIALGVIVEVTLCGPILLLKTDLTPNEHDIVSTGSKYYAVDTEGLPPAFRRQYADHIARIGGFNIGMALPSAMVDLINPDPIEDY